MLAAAAVIGLDVDSHVLGPVAELNEDELIDVLDAAVDTELLAETPAAPGRYSFVHALIQRAVYDELSVPRRQQLHGRIAEALEALSNADAHVAELAHHWSAAGPTAPIGKVLGFAIAAGDHAQRQLAPDEAVRWYAHALELTDRVDPATRDQQRCDVLLHLGRAQRLAGRPEFGQTLLDAARLAQHLGDTDRLAAAALMNTRGLTAHVGWLDDERVSVLQAALDAVGTSSAGLRARLLARWAVETMLSPGYDNEALIAEALALTETCDDPNARLSALGALLSKAIPHNLDQRRAVQAELLELASQLEPAQRVWTFSACCVQAVQAGELIEAQRFLDGMARTAQAAADPTGRWMAEAFAAALSALHGDHVLAEQHANAALQLGLQAAQPDALQVHGTLLREIRRVQGREAELCEQTAEMSAKYPGLRALRGALAWLLTASNRSDEARAILDDLLADLPSMPIDRVWAPMLAQCTEAAAQIGHTATVRAVVPLLGPFADQWIFNGGNTDGPIALVLATARTALANYDEAENDFEQALAMAEHADSRYWMARTQLEWASMLRHRNQADDHRRASTLVREAVRTAVEHGYAGIERRGTTLAPA